MDFDNLVITTEKKTFEKPKAGLQNAICVGVWNVGRQKIEFQNEVKFKDQIIIGFELEQRSTDRDEPMLHLEKYNMSLHEKSKLAPVVESWFSKKLNDSERYNYDLRTLIGKRATLNLIENGDYINISTVLPPQESNKLESENVLKGEVPNFVKVMREKAVQENSVEEPKIDISEIKPVEKAPF